MFSITYYATVAYESDRFRNNTRNTLQGAKNSASSGSGASGARGRRVSIRTSSDSSLPEAYRTRRARATNLNNASTKQY